MSELVGWAESKVSCGTVDIVLLESEIVALGEVLEANQIPFLWSMKETFARWGP